MENKIIDALLGLSIGDALGVPVEFLSRAEIARDPVTGMRAYGTHHQPAGTWSDDSAMAFCLAEALCSGYTLNGIAGHFVLWFEEGFWSAHGEVFDVGIATSQAIWELKKGVSPLQSGNTAENSNGNGSLMRILPLVFYIRDMDMAERFQKVAEVSSITHAHVRSMVACFIYTEFALQLLLGLEKMQAYQNMQHSVNTFLKESGKCSADELHRFHKILENPYDPYQIRPILDYSENEIGSSGYVVETLEASIWCFLKFDNFRDTVLKAVNLGADTDTTGCVAGGLAGLYYGRENIPGEWIEVLARKEEIVHLAERLHQAMVNNK